MEAVSGAHSCGAQLDFMLGAYFWLGIARAHVDSMAGPERSVLRSYLHLLHTQTDNVWHQVRIVCRL
jgi:hypothetical protein